MRFTLSSMAGLLGLASAQGLRSSAYTDPKTGIDFQRFVDDGYSLGIAVPETLGKDLIAQMVFPREKEGWGGISFRGGMVGGMLFVAWPNGDDIVTSFRMANSYANPDVYTNSTVKATPIPDGTFINSTHVSYTFLCEGCVVKETTSLTGESPVVGYAWSSIDVDTPSDPESALNYHGAGFGQFGLDIKKAASAKFATWAAMAKETTPTPGTGTPGVPGNSTTLPPTTSNRWPKGWSWADLSKAADRLYERNPGTTSPSDDGKYYDDRTYTILSGYLSAKGWKEVDSIEEPNEKHLVYSRPSWSIKNNMRAGPARTYMPFAKNLPNFTLKLETKVIQPIRTGSKITGVLTQGANGSKQIINVKAGGKVVLAAGAMSTPRLLWNAGIGKSDALAIVKQGASKTGVTLPAASDLIDLPVGHHLQDHAQVMLQFKTKSNFTAYKFNNIATEPVKSDLELYYQGSGPITQAAQRMHLWTSAKGADGRVRYLQGTASAMADGIITVRTFLTHGTSTVGELGITAGGNTVLNTKPWLIDQEDRKAMADFVQYWLDLTSGSNSTLSYITPGATVDDILATKMISGDHWMGSAKMGNHPIFPKFHSERVRDPTSSRINPPLFLYCLVRLKAVFSMDGETERAKSTRVGYKKSRNGCIRCKKRRVKCDEEVPCSACVRHRVRCSLELVKSDDYQEQKPLINRSLQTPSHSLPAGSPASLLSSSLFSSPLDEPDCWVSTAELMLHYTTVTYKTMVFNERTIPTFQQSVPQVALGYPWFLRQILAFSGYHLAHLHPEKRHSYLLQASKHQNASLRGLREALSEPVTSSNCHALYASTTFIVVNKFAAFPNCDDFRSHGCSQPVQSLMEIFSLVNGMEAVLHSPGAADLRNGPLKELFCETPHPHVNSYLLRGLHARLPELARRIASDSMEDQSRAVLTSAVVSITGCVDDAFSNLYKVSPPELRVIFSWPMSVPRDFLDLAVSGHPLALIILAYYDILLYWGETEYWFFENWAEALITAIVEKVKGSPWDDLLNWPVEVILHH
ncbi:Uncharacterized protein Y057_5644 [Fusarium fujikuroi]|nr:Uncharacterized protein Y057_5644 [Fusarium fujikuroi]